MKIQSVAVYSYERIIASLEAYRLFNPMTRANLQINRGVVDGEFSTVAIKDSDIIVFQREFPAILSNYLAVISQAANLDKSVVMDMDDDLLALPIHHPDRVKLNYAKAQIPILTGMVKAKALTVTTPYLADQLRKYNTNIFILPNFLDDSLWEFNAPQVEPIGDKIRIFYMGTVTHVPDLEMLKPAYRALAMKYPGRLEFMFYGANLEFEENLPATITNCQSETFVFADYVKIALAQKANIAIAPLEDIPYNHCKSSIKYFEYTAMGLPGVYSRVTPYTSVIVEGKNGFTASSIHEWIDALSQLIENPHLREKITLAAQETVRRDWLLSDHAHLWPETYSQIVELKTRNESKLISYLPTLEDINLHLDTFFKKQEQEKSEVVWHLQERTQALTAVSKENADLNWQVQQANQALTAVSKENADLNWQVQQANQALTEKIGHNDVLHNRLDILGQENERLNSELVLRAKDLEKIVVEKNQDLELVTALKNQVDDLSVQWIDHTRQIQTLESESKFVKEGWDATKLEAVNYSLSRSWRLTRPMRKITKALRDR